MLNWRHTILSLKRMRISGYAYDSKQELPMRKLSYARKRNNEEHITSRFHKTISKY
jgi:hypothetical protein